MATGLLILSAVSAIGGAIQQRKVSKAQRKQNKIQNRIAAISRRRNIRRSIAERRIQTAEIQSVGFQLGVSGGTAVQGAVAGVTTDVAGAIGASNLQFRGQQAVADLANRISGFQQTQQAFGAVGAIAQQFGGEQGAQSRAAVADLVGF